MTLILLMVVGHAMGYPQDVEQDVIVIKHGHSTTVSSRGLSSASSGSILIASISAVRGDRATIAATGVGETTLELTHRDGTKRVLKLRVEPATVRSRTVVARTEPSPANGSVAQVKIDEGNKPDPTQSPNPVTAADSNNVSRGTRPRRVQFAVDFIYVSESETFPLLNEHEEHEHLHPQDTVKASRNLIVIPLTMRFMASSRDTITATIPYIRRDDRISFSGQSVRSRSHGLGDIQLAFDRRFDPGWESWSGSWGVGIRLPTGKSVYNIKEGESPIGAGHWELSGSAGLSRLFNQITFRSNLAVTYALPRVVNGVKFSPGWGHGFQTGIDYLASDRWTVSQQLVHLRRQNVFLTTPLDQGTEIVNQAYLSHSLFFQPKRFGHAYRLRFDVGLNNTASDLSLSFGYQW
jgi:hypothetical protein